MYFTVNLAFINYFDNLNDFLKFSISLNRTTYKQILLVSLEASDFKAELLKAPETFKKYAQ